MSNPTTTFSTPFEEDVYHGLTAFPKYLYSKYFYDETGDKLFQQIMQMPEYYLTNAEYDILEESKHALAESFQTEQGFDLIELGAGDGKKTKVLLHHFTDKGLDFTYQPIDISQNALDGLTSSLKDEIPNLDVVPQQGTYFEVLERLKGLSTRRKVVMMLGSNIGNLLHPQAIDFLRKLQNTMNEDDLLFIGFDQKKHPQQVLDAYNDASGITEAFNKNVLKRINRELNADFDLDQFMHWEVYDPETGTAKSFLVSKRKQKVTIKGLDIEVHFDPWETIHTEISQKYDDKVVSWLAEQAQLRITENYTDSKRSFKNYTFKKI